MCKRIKASAEKKRKNRGINRVIIVSERKAFAILLPSYGAHGERSVCPIFIRRGRWK
nr:MAG TPA: hypothetical protein [Caudoviricetes sp.]